MGEFKPRVYTRNADPRAARCASGRGGRARSSPPNAAPPDSAPAMSYRPSPGLRASGAARDALASVAAPAGTRQSRRAEPAPREREVGSGRRPRGRLANGARGASADARRTPRAKSWRHDAPVAVDRLDADAAVPLLELGGEEDVREPTRACASAVTGRARRG